MTRRIFLRYGFVLVLILIAAVAQMASVGAAVIPIDTTYPGGITAAVSAAGSGGTVILAPGTYEEHAISVGNSVTIEANASLGGNEDNTIIDGSGGTSGIFNDGGGYNLAIDNLTLTGGRKTSGDDLGGAIESGGPTTITSSTFTNCSSSIGGGAIESGGPTTITSSTFTNCSASDGGAIESGGPTTITSSTFTNCSASNGGAIESSDPTTITSSTFTDCSSSSGGGAIESGGPTTITSSTFTDCSADSFGGAIEANAATTITSSTFTDCSTDFFGGAIIGFPFSSINLTSSTITNCSALEGGAIYGLEGRIIMQFSRIYNDNTGTAVVNSDGFLTATDNWWGTNNPNFSTLIRGSVTDTPYLELDITANPTSIPYSQTSTITANLTCDSGGACHNPAGGHVQDGIPILFSVTGVTGSFSPLSGVETTNGANITTFHPGSSGTGTVKAMVDGQTVSTALTITTTPVTGIGAITGVPEVGQVLTNGTVTPSSATVTYQWNESASINGPFSPISGANTETYTLESNDNGYYIEMNVTGIGGYSGFVNSTPVGPVKAIPTPIPTSPGGHGSGTDYWATGGPGDQGYTGPQPTPLGLSQPVQNLPPNEVTPAIVQQQPSTGSQPPGSSAASSGTGSSSGGIPVVSVVAGVAGIGVLTGGGFLVHRWWIRKQNPALFRKYD